MSEPHYQLLQRGAAALNFRLNQRQLGQFAGYEQLLLKWNQEFNLTAIIESSEIELKHFLDSISCILVTGDLTGKTLIDVGSGGGFPGIPLKIVFPGLRLTLVESQAKKCRFLEAVGQELGLLEVTLVNERIETIGQNAKYREKFDWAVARAVAPLEVLAEYLLPLVRLGGRTLAQKGPQATEELAVAQHAFELLGGGASRRVAVELPGLAGIRSLIVTEKIRNTPLKYPRRAGVALKRPLR